MANYIKRLIKYVVSEHRQPIVNVKLSQKDYGEEFNNKKYLITGGGSGIGFEIAKRLNNSGAFVIITGRNEDKLKTAVKKIGDESTYFVCDITKTHKIDDVFQKIIKKYGHIDGLVNNAGISLHEWDFLKVTEDGYDAQFNTNLRGSFFLTQSYIKNTLEENSHGNVLFISSERGGMAEVIPYGLTKASINSLVRGLSYKYYSKNIRINAIAPGVTASEMTNIKKDGDLFSESPSGRVFLPEEVAEISAFLLSDASKCISGEIIHTNGGNHIKMGW